MSLKKPPAKLKIKPVPSLVPNNFPSQLIATKAVQEKDEDKFYHILWLLLGSDGSPISLSILSESHDYHVVV